MNAGLLEGPEWEELGGGGESKVFSLKSKVEGSGRQSGAHGVTRPTRPRSLNPTPLINRAAVRDKALALAAKERAHTWTRVSEDFLQEVNDAALRAIVSHVARMPSKGKTDMSDERFNQFLAGPLHHPLPMFTMSRLAMALRSVVEATGAAGEKALEEHCREREERDGTAAEEDEGPKMGACCICGETSRWVRNIIMLDRKSPTPGRGWGCVQCGLPSDGAVAVLCDECSEALKAERKQLVTACVGYPGTDGRVPFSSLIGTHEHDMAKHAEESAQ